MLSLYYAGTVFCTDQVKYHYRQHPGQDIRQGDERMLASLEMYRMVLKRAVADGAEGCKYRDLTTKAIDDAKAWLQDIEDKASEEAGTSSETESNEGSEAGDEEYQGL